MTTQLPKINTQVKTNLSIIVQQDTQKYNSTVQQRTQRGLSLGESIALMNNKRNIFQSANISPKKESVSIEQGDLLAQQQLFQNQKNQFSVQSGKKVLIRGGVYQVQGQQESIQGLSEFLVQRVKDLGQKIRNLFQEVGGQKCQIKGSKLCLEIIELLSKEEQFELKGEFQQVYQILGKQILCQDNVIIDQLNDLNLNKSEKENLNFDTKVYSYKQIVQILIQVMEYYNQQKEQILTERDEIYGDAVQMKEEQKGKYQILFEKYNILQKDFKEKLRQQTEKIIEENKKLFQENISQNLYINKMKQELNFMQEKLSNLIAANNPSNNANNLLNVYENEEESKQTANTMAKTKQTEKINSTTTNNNGNGKINQSLVLENREVQIYKNLITKVKNFTTENQILKDKISMLENKLSLLLQEKNSLQMEIEDKNKNFTPRPNLNRIQELLQIKKTVSNNQNIQQSNQNQMKNSQFISASQHSSSQQSQQNQSQQMETKINQNSTHEQIKEITTQLNKFMKFIQMQSKKGTQNNQPTTNNNSLNVNNKQIQFQVLNSLGKTQIQQENQNPSSQQEYFLADENIQSSKESKKNNKNSEKHKKSHSVHGNYKKIEISIPRKDSDESINPLFSPENQLFQKYKNYFENTFFSNIIDHHRKEEDKNSNSYLESENNNVKEQFLRYIKNNPKKNK